MGPSSFAEERDGGGDFGVVEEREKGMGMMGIGGNGNGNGGGRV